mmetsp:Transcript_76337/g.220598  ORF Transcript_76337/g.220598 Transcript_76337/m.220598 type:complete len:202 (-) Transcript_76337:8-613(-)
MAALAEGMRVSTICSTQPLAAIVTITTWPTRAATFSKFATASECSLSAATSSSKHFGFASWYVVGHRVSSQSKMMMVSSRSCHDSMCDTLQGLVGSTSAAALFAAAAAVSLAASSSSISPGTGFDAGLAGTSTTSVPAPALSARLAAFEGTPPAPAATSMPPGGARLANSGVPAAWTGSCGSAHVMLLAPRAHLCWPRMMA